MESKYNKNIAESLAIELTHDCNNNCLFCYQKRRRKIKADPDQLKIKLIEYREMGVKYVEFSGGEPTLSPYLSDLIHLAKRMKYENISLLTNGRMLAYEGYLSKLIRSGLKTAIFSFPGHNANLYKKIALADKSGFKQFIKGLEAAEKEKGKIEVGTVTVINNYNYRYLPQIVNWLAEKKLDFITLSYPIPLEEGMNQKMFPTYAEIYPFLKETLDKYGKKVKICIDGVPYCQLPRYEKYILNEVFKKDCFIVDPGGKVSSRLEAIKLLSAKKAGKCTECSFNNRCVGLFVDYVSEYNKIDTEKVFGEQKVALDIQSGSCDYDYIFCTRKIDGKRFNKLTGDRAVIDYVKLKLFFNTSSKLSNSLEIWGRERVDEFEEINKILGMAKKYFRNITLWSSGLNLDKEKRVSCFLKSGTTKFEIPVYGSSDKIHSRVTKKSGSFKKIVSSIRCLEKLGVNIGLHTVAIKQNCEDLPKIIRLASNFKRTTLSVWFYYPDQKTDQEEDGAYQKYCCSYSEIIHSLSQGKWDIGNSCPEFVFFPKCIFSKIKRVMKKAKLIRPGFARLMVANNQGMTYKYIDGRKEFDVVYSQKCELCREKNKCSGVFSEYLKIYGDKELEPIVKNK